MNKVFSLMLLIIPVLLSCHLHAQPFVSRDSLLTKIPATSTSMPAHQQQMNFFVISKPKTIFDPATRFNILRARIKSFFRPKKFTCIVALSSEQMSDRMLSILKKNHLRIGSLWFDSHGSYARGYSYFTIGKDEFNYVSIHDQKRILPLQELAPYCDIHTSIGIGSCYGGATYCRPVASGSFQMPMYGDSLMKGMGRIFPSATIYACESWVMTKPGLFKGKFALAGYPLRKKFRDLAFEPAWNRLGMWNSYRNSTGTLRPVNCVTLTPDGDIITRAISYQSLKKVKRKIAHGLTRLRPNLLKT